ncbi:MAG TPA: hypothetical protein VFV38_25525 [Ktedonobacteraceae bacterium]|nr:hypothetical protein [Ktedonobacteraceae bacterium]
MSATEERRGQLTALLAQEHQGLTTELRIDVEMRVMLAQYDALERRRAQLLEENQYKQTGECSPSTPTARAFKAIFIREQTIQARLEFAGDLLTIDRMVIAACLSTISLHYLEHGESSFEHAYPLLQGYFLGENILLFPQLGFLTKEEVLQLLEVEQENQEDAQEKQ